MYRRQGWTVSNGVQTGRIGPKSVPRGQVDERESAARLTAALRFCACALRDLDVERIRDARARTWVLTIARAVETGSEGKAQLSAREQAAFSHALDCFTSWLQAEPRRMVWR